MTTLDQARALLSQLTTAAGIAQAQLTQLTAAAGAAQALVDSMTPAAPPPPVPQPPAPTGVTIEAWANDHYQAVFPTGSALAGQRWKAGPRDMLRLGAVRPPRPWSIFADPATMTLAQPAQGRIVPAWDVLPVYGARNYSSWTTPTIAGAKFVQAYPIPSTDGAALRRALDEGRILTASGPRGVGMATAYCTWHCHVDWAKDDNGNVLAGTRSTNPMAPLAVGITVDGRMCRLTKDGGVHYDAQMPRRPSSYFYDFTYWDLDRSVQYVADTGAGEILHVRHTPKVPQSFTAVTAATGFARPTSLRAVGDTVYVVEAQTGAITAWRPADGTRRAVCTIPGAWWIDYDSQGRLVVLDLSLRVTIVDPASGATVNTWAATVPYSGARGWVQCSVNRTGSCGPVDAVLVCGSTGPGNTDIYMRTIHGAPLKLHAAQGQNVVGPSARASEISHYPWVADFHPTQAVIVLHGFAEMAPTILVADQGRQWAPYDMARGIRARQALLDGGPPDARGQVPSFTCQVGLHGWSYGLLTFDALADMTVAEAAAFLRSGGIGSVPRTIPDAVVRDILWWARYNSEAHVRHATAGTATGWLAEVDSSTGG